ncbi:peptidoglycan editing factor PgeF [soil metagenome]
MDKTASSSFKIASGPESAGGVVFLTPEPQPQDARVQYFTRLGGLSKPPFDSLNVSVRIGDTREAVGENLVRIAKSMYGTSSAWVQQLSGTEVSRVSDSGFAGQGDSLVTAEEDLALVVAVADCVPVALVSHHEVAMVHSGWRGTIGGIASKTAAEMNMGAVSAYIGPCIRECCYEVSEDLARRFADRFGSEVVSGRYLSLPAAIRSDLEEQGISEVYDLGLCTGCRPDLFYSHRKEGPKTGRTLASVVKVS